MNSSPVPCSRSWSISDESLRRYVHFASESCIQELLSASVSNKTMNGGEEWKVLSINNGVEISKRRSGSHHMFRSRWVLNSVSPQQFIAVANAIDAAKQWDSDLVEGRYIKDLEDNLSIIHLRFGGNSKPLFRNREFIVYERRETMEDGTLVVAVVSLPKEIAAGLHPKQNNTIRGLLLQSGWVVEKIEDDSCLVTYVIQNLHGEDINTKNITRNVTQLTVLISDVPIKSYRSETMPFVETVDVRICVGEDINTENIMRNVTQLMVLISDVPIKSYGSVTE